MKFFTKLFCISTLLLAITNTQAQCIVGETELVLDIATDDWGLECYWQITPLGNACDNGTIAEGGNIVQIGCGGAGDQDATNGNGYASNTTITEDQICLIIGESYTLYYIDDYEDGGAHFTLNLFGFPMLQFTGMGSNDEFNFTVQEPLQYDVACNQVLSYNYVQPTDIEIRAKFFHNGSDVINSVEMNYTSDSGTPVTSTIDGLNIQPFTSFELVHPLPLNTTNGNHNLSIWLSSINGNPDMNALNDIASKAITAGPGTPNILDTYLDYNTEMQEIAGSAQGVDHPRDLDFHPTLTNNELWVILKKVENSGGSTVKISHAGEASQEELVQTDGNAWHFMSLPTAISFSRNENFATSPGVYDANHDGGMPFTGPTLWDSNPAVYAQPSGGNGSHIDMLHESPYSMGITWEKDNKFWVNCGDHNEIMSYDFQEDHGPGNSDHSDGIIYKYPIPGYSEDSDHEIPDHMIMDHNTGWLYACNSQQNRIIRLNTATGTPGDDVTPHEAVSIYKYMDNFTWEVYLNTGLDTPTGIDIIEDRMIVSNYNSGDIHLYDISNAQPILLGVIPTGESGIMGIKIGPDGLIWYVNSITNQVMRVGMTTVEVEEVSTPLALTLSPNPAKENVRINLNSFDPTSKSYVRILDFSGKLLTEKNIQSKSTVLDVSMLSDGVYILQYLSDHSVLSTQKIVVQK